VLLEDTKRAMSHRCCPVSERLAKQISTLCCPVTQRLGKQLSRKIFCLVWIFKEFEQALLVCHGGPYWVES